MIPPSYSPQKVEAEVSKFWKEKKIYEKVKSRSGRKFYFVDGPPYTTGRIHLGTAWNKIIKDTILRYKRMNGYDITDTPGWDMHGLPIEVKVEQEFGFKNKRDIEKFGVEKFVQKCMEYALKNKDAMTEQFKSLGVWMDWENPYMTIKAEYINAAWFAIKKAHEKGLLERKLMVVNWCPRCETALADAEVEYAEKEDPSIYVKFPIKNEPNTYIVIWTTTPWTLPANIAVAVNPAFEYAKFRAIKNSKEEFLILAKDLAEDVLSKGDYKHWEIIETYNGKELEGLEYEHIFANEVPKQKIWTHKVYTASFVTAENTGCVHIAPGHGLEDYELAISKNLPIFNPVDERGVYNEDAGIFAGLRVFEANDVVIDKLYEKNLILYEGKIIHRYGHCWRCKSPIIYRSTEQWFIAITKIKEKMLEEINKVVWIPEWAGSARFKDWISNAKDWCISRQRYWGIPIPVWICEKCGEMRIVGSIDEIEWKEDIDLHKPRIDEITFECKCGGVMKRVPDVFDVWFDSGVASWASIGYPAKKELFEKLWPADFITEGHDQTRGWFYSQLGTSIICFDRAPYKTVLMHGFTLDELGRKMSKSLGNVIEPEEVIEQIGVDCFRLYVLSSAPWEDLRFSWDEARNINRMMNVIWNAVRFAYTYMSLDNFKYEGIKHELSVEDRWILSRLERFVKSANNEMENCQLHRVVRNFLEFFLGDFSRWYIQLIRSRVWEEKESPSKLAAYETMFKVIDKSIRIIAPFAPFISEWFYQNFFKSFRKTEESIFLEDYPKAEEEYIDDELEIKMKIIRQIFEATSAARNKAKRKLRWPLRELIVETQKEKIAEAVESLKNILLNQCNVKEIKVVKNFEKKVVIKPNFKVVGPILKNKVSEFAKFVENLRELPEKIVFEGIELGRDALIVEYEIPAGFVYESFEGGVVYLYTELDKDLIREAYAREIVRRIQEMRKEMNLNVEDYIRSYLDVDPELVEGWREYIMRETRSKELVFGELKGYIKDWDVEGMKFKIGIERWS
ncbi:MAG: isoleucine--tRNA ligase [Archaeoglobales archaeon]|nr:isoleucine--tRNA ligase [Archaeoglobales archaeon]